MRLGDLDALYDCVEARYRLSSGEGHKVERALLDAICDSPTIPAIPVGWLEAQIVPYGDKLSDEVKGVFNATIREMIYRWQQEQEAR